MSVFKMMVIVFVLLNTVQYICIGLILDQVIMKKALVT